MTQATHSRTVQYRIVFGCGVALAALLLPSLNRLMPPSTARADDPAGPDILDKIEDILVRHRTEHYAIAGTDAVDQRRLEEYGRALEYIHKEYTKGFGQLLSDEPAKTRSAGRNKPPADDEGSKRPVGKRSAGGAKGKAAQVEGPEGDAKRFRVLVFANNKEYQHFGKQYLQGETEHSTGMFVPEIKSLLIVYDKNNKNPYEILFHEAFHQFLGQHIKNPPVWLNEGLATYYGLAKPTPKGLVWSKPPRGWIETCRQCLQFKAVVPFWNLVRASRAEFYDTRTLEVPGFSSKEIRRTLYYAQSYTLVAMMSGDRVHRKRLQDYVRDLAKDDGSNTDKITDQFFNVATCNQLANSWGKYINDRRR